MIKTAVSVLVFPKCSCLTAHFEKERRKIFGEKLFVIHVHKHVHSEIKPDECIFGAEFITIGGKFLEVAYHVLLKLCIFGLVKVSAAVKDGVILTRLGDVLFVDKLSAVKPCRMVNEKLSVKGKLSRLLA